MTARRFGRVRKEVGALMRLLVKGGRDPRFAVFRFRRASWFVFRSFPRPLITSFLAGFDPEPNDQTFVEISASAQSPRRRLRVDCALALISTHLSTASTATVRYVGCVHVCRRGRRYTKRPRYVYTAPQHSQHSHAATYAHDSHGVRVRGCT